MQSCAQVIQDYQAIGTIKPNYPDTPIIDFHSFIDADMLKRVEVPAAGQPYLFQYSFAVPHERKYSHITTWLRHYIAFSLEKYSDIEYAFSFVPLNESQKNVIRTAMDQWEKIANIKFIETTETDGVYTSIVQFELYDTSEKTIRKFDCKLDNPFYKGNFFPTHNSINALAINGYYFNHCESIHSPRSLKTSLHELGHALSLQHYFESPSISAETNTTTYSIMNYEIEREGHNQIYPISPMPVDMLALHHIFGANPHTHAGNTTYQLHHLTTAYPGYKTISSLYDAGGIDTFDASQVMQDAIFINLRPYSRSNLGTCYLALPDIQIENVIASHFNNTIILNSLDNIIDISHSKNSTIVIDPQFCGHDKILGFNEKTSQIILERAPLNHASTWKIDSSIEQDGVHTHIIFDSENEIELISDEIISLNAGNFYSLEYNDAVQCQLSSDHSILSSILKHSQAAFSHFPETFYQDFLTSLKNGIAIGFILGLTEEQLRKYQCSEQQIFICLSLMHCLLSIVTGTLLSGAASFLTSSACRYLGFSEKTTYLASRVASELAADLNLVSLPARLCCHTLAQTSAALLCRVGLWSKNHLVKKYYNDAEMSKPYVHII